MLQRIQQHLIEHVEVERKLKWELVTCARLQGPMYGARSPRHLVGACAHRNLDISVSLSLTHSHCVRSIALRQHPLDTAHPTHHTKQQYIRPDNPHRCASRAAANNTPSMASGALCSDHVNYLILRYLQEAGHENAAIAFWRDWHRLPEFKDPENYPFAPVVRRGELVNVIQDGLQHDELIARVKKNERKFHFTSVTTREALERRGDGAAVENGVVGSRPGSSGKRKGARPLGMPPPDEFPTPAPKRQRRSEGSEGVQLNGDAMDVDAASGSPDGDVDEDGTATSPGEGEEVEIVEVPERYDSMDAAVQTTVKAGPATKTMYWKVDKPGAVIHHSAFSPAVKSDGVETSTLLTVGESLCRFYQVPDDVDDSKKVRNPTIAFRYRVNTPYLDSIDRRPNTPTQCMGNGSNLVARRLYRRLRNRQLSRLTGWKARIAADVANAQSHHRHVLALHLPSTAGARSNHSSTALSSQAASC